MKSPLCKFATAGIWMRNMCWWTVSVSPAAFSILAWCSSTTPKERIARGDDPFYYLPKMESHLEARLWNDIFVMAQNECGIPQGTIKATVLDGNHSRHEMEEILYELRDHSAKA